MAEIQHKTKTRGFGDNVDFHSDRTQSTDKPKRISVDELYGKNPFSRLMIQMISRPVEHLMWRLVRIRRQFWQPLVQDLWR